MKGQDSQSGAPLRAAASGGRWWRSPWLPAAATTTTVAEPTGTTPAGTSGGEGSGRGDALKIAIMTDCEGAFGFGYELDIGGAQAAMYEYAGATPNDPEKPSAGHERRLGRGNAISRSSATAAVTTPPTRRSWRRVVSWSSSTPTS